MRNILLFFLRLAFFFSAIQETVAQTFDTTTLSSPKSGETNTTITGLTNATTTTYFAFRTIGTTKYVGGTFSPPVYFAMSDLRKVTATSDTTVTVTLAPFLLSDTQKQEVVLLSARQGGWGLSVTSKTYTLDTFPPAASSTLMKAFTFKNLDTFIFGSSKGFSSARKTSTGTYNYGGVIATRILGLNSSTPYDALKCKLKFNATGILYTVTLGSDLIMANSSLKEGKYMLFTTDQKYLFKKPDYKMLTIFGSIELDVITTDLVECETVTGTAVNSVQVDYYSLVSKIANSSTTKTVAPSVTCIPGCTRCDKNNTCLDTTCLLDPFTPKCLNTSIENCPASYLYAFDKLTRGDQCFSRIAGAVQLKELLISDTNVTMGPLVNPVTILGDDLDQYILIYAEIGTLLLSSKLYFPLNLPQKLNNQISLTTNRIIFRFANYAYNPNFPYAPKNVIGIRIGGQSTNITMVVRNLTTTYLGSLLNPYSAAFDGFEFETIDQFTAKKGNTYLVQFHINRTSTATRIGLRAPTDYILIFTDGQAQEAYLTNNALIYNPSLCTAGTPCFLHIAFTAQIDGPFQFDPSLLTTGMILPNNRPVKGIVLQSDYVCPPGASIKSNPKLCECNDGYFPNTVQSVACALCHSDCKTCFNGTNTTCLSCYSPFVLVNYSCVCPTGYTRSGSQCIPINSNTTPGNQTQTPGTNDTNPSNTNGTTNGTTPTNNTSDNNNGTSPDNTTTPNNGTNPTNNTGDDSNSTTPDNSTSPDSNNGTTPTNSTSDNNGTAPDNGGNNNGTNPNNETTVGNTTNPSNGTDPNNGTTPTNNTSDNNGTLPDNTTNPNNVTNPTNNTEEGNNSTTPDNSTSLGNGTTPTNTTTDNNGTPDNGGNNNGTNPNNEATPGNSTSPSNGTDPNNGTIPDNTTNPNNETNPINGTTPTNNTIDNNNGTSPDNTTSPNNGTNPTNNTEEGNNSTIPDNSTSPGNGTTPTNNTTDNNGTTPDNGGNNNGTNLNNETTPGNSTGPTNGTDPNNGTIPDNTTSPNNETLPNNGTNPTNNTGDGSNSTTPDNSTSPGNGTESNNGTTPTNNTSDNNGTTTENGGNNNGTDPNNGTVPDNTNNETFPNNGTNPPNNTGDGNNSTTPDNSTNPGNGTDSNNGTTPTNNTGNNNGTIPNDGGNNGTNPTNETKSGNSTSPSNGTDPNNGTIPDNITSPSNETDPNNGTVPGNNTGNNNESSPNNGTGSNNGSDPNNGTTPNNSTGNGENNNGTNPNNETTPGNSTSPINGTDPDNGTNPGNTTSPSNETNPDNSTGSTNGTNPDNNGNGTSSTNNTGNTGTNPSNGEDKPNNGGDDGQLSNEDPGSDNDPRNVSPNSFDKEVLAADTNTQWIKIIYLLFYGVSFIVSFLSLKKYREKVLPAKYDNPSVTESKTSLISDSNSLKNVFVSYSPLFFPYNKKLQPKYKALCVFHSIITINVKLFIGAMMAKQLINADNVIDFDNVKQRFATIIATEVSITIGFTLVYSALFKYFRKSPLKLIVGFTLGSIAMVVCTERFSLNILQNSAGGLLIGYSAASMIIQYILLDGLLAVMSKYLSIVRRMRKLNLFKENENKMRAISVASLQQAVNTVPSLNSERHTSRENRIFKLFKFNPTQIVPSEPPAPASLVLNE